MKNTILLSLRGGSTILLKHKGHSSFLCRSFTDNFKSEIQNTADISKDQKNWNWVPPRHNSDERLDDEVIPVIKR
jgi:hypothetical protein